jgi:hypothetical protein
MPSYRALISMPIEAANDDDAEEIAVRHANSLLHPGSKVIGGHVELLIQVADGGGLSPRRIVVEEAGFLTQLT